MQASLDVRLLDLKMLGMGSINLARVVREQQPDAVKMIISGTLDDAPDPAQQLAVTSISTTASPEHVRKCLAHAPPVSPSAL